MKQLFWTLYLFITLALYIGIYIWCQQNPAYDNIGLIAANTILSLLCLISYFMIQNNLKTGRVQAFVNGVYGATLLRLMVCMAAALIYILNNIKTIHKPTLFAMMGLYIVYTTFEIIIFGKMSRKPNT